MKQPIPFLSCFLLIKVGWQRPVGFPALRKYMFYGQVFLNLGLFGQRRLAVLLLNSLKDESQSAPRQQSVERQGTEGVFQVIVGRPPPGIGLLTTEELDNDFTGIFRPTVV